MGEEEDRRGRGYRNGGKEVSKDETAMQTERKRESMDQDYGTLVSILAKGKGKEGASEGRKVSYEKGGWREKLEENKTEESRQKIQKMGRRVEGKTETKVGRKG